LTERDFNARFEDFLDAVMPMVVLVTALVVTISSFALMGYGLLWAARNVFLWFAGMVSPL